MWWRISKKHNSLPSFSVDRGILQLFGQDKHQFFPQANRDYSVRARDVRFDYTCEKSNCCFSVFQILCTNCMFLLTYSWLVTRVKFSSRRWGQDSPAMASATILTPRQSLQDLSVEHAIDVVDCMGAVSTSHANPPAVMQDFCRQTL